ncbi:hypothetical protein AeMF1_008350 [Aphanomyces euteiches]|nr:hypothetical protein AeMF1_011135 [Aphanomyces euteiches]KAH9118567.1 hypothetical protein AeMF1_008350 [Aphanomyces euteiches]
MSPTTKSEDTKQEPIVFRGKNFDDFKLRIQAKLRSKSLWNIVNGSETPASDTNDTNFETKEAKAFDLLVNALDDEYLTYVTHVGTSSKVWKLLTDRYEARTYADVSHVAHELHTKIYVAGSSTQSHITDMRGLQQKHLFMGTRIDDDMLGRIILTSVKDIFPTTVEILRNRESSPTLQLVIDRLLSKESEEARSSNKRKAPVFKKRDVAKGIQRKCMPSEDQEINVLEHTGEEGFILVTSLERSDLSDYWILDSACTADISGDKAFFTKLSRNGRVMLKIANDDSIKSTQCGPVSIQVDKDQVLTRDQVMYVPGLTKNLLSLCKLLQDGFKIAKWTSDSAILIKDTLALKFQVQHGLYVLHEDTGMDNPTKALGGKTPFEVIYGRRPNIEHLRPFGCTAFAFIDKAKRSKLDSRASKCILLGYGSQRKSYRLQDCSTGELFECRSWELNQSIPDHHFQLATDTRFPNPRESFGDNDAQVLTPRRGRSNASQNDDVDANGTSLTTVDTTSHDQDNDDTSSHIIPNHSVDDADEVHDEDNEAPNASNSEPEFDDPMGLEAISRGFHQVYSVQVLNETPLSFSDVDKSPNRLKWLEATQDEYESLALKCKWLWRIKFDEEGNMTKFKARLVLKGYMQRYGIDYLEIFAPVLRMNTLRLLLCLVAHNEWKIRQLDVKTAFLNGQLEDDSELYMEQPPRYAVPGEETKVCQLNKSIYGLKQAPRCWYLTLHTYLVQVGFERCKQEVCLYVKRVGDSVVLLSVYVDDITVTGSSNSHIEDACNALKSNFEMTDLGELKSILGIKVSVNGNTVRLCQQGYAELQPLKRSLVPTHLGQDEVKNLNLAYRELVGSLQYLVTATRPYIANAVRNLSKHLAKYDDSHWKQAKRVLRYLQGTKSASLLIDGNNQVGAFQLTAYCDADFANGEDRKSISGYAVMYGSCCLSYRSRKQSIVALSTAEAEYIALADCVKELLWFSELLEELGFPQRTITVHCDNQSAIAIAKNPGQHERTKHISTKYQL